MNKVLRSRFKLYFDVQESQDSLDCCSNMSLTAPRQQSSIQMVASCLSMRTSVEGNRQIVEIVKSHHASSQLTYIDRRLQIRFLLLLPGHCISNVVQYGAFHLNVGFDGRTSEFQVERGRRQSGSTMSFVICLSTLNLTLAILMTMFLPISLFRIQSSGSQIRIRCAICVTQLNLFRSGLGFANQLGFKNAWASRFVRS